MALKTHEYLKNVMEIMGIKSQGVTKKGKKIWFNEHVVNIEGTNKNIFF